MGQSKQMLEIDGEPLLVKSLHSFLDTGILHVTVILGAREKEHRDLIKDLPIDIVYNPQWASGMGSSIKSGIRHIASKDPSVDAVILSVCDQPLLSAKLISNIILEHGKTGKPIVASGYAGLPGVPVLFHKSYFEKLGNLPDDEGAKKIILRNPDDVSVIPFDGGEVDLDTMEDYKKFLGS